MFKVMVGQQSGWPKPNEGSTMGDSAFCCGPVNTGLGLPGAGRWTESLPHVGPCQAFGPFQLSEQTQFLVFPHVASPPSPLFWTHSLTVNFSCLGNLHPILHQGGGKVTFEIKMKLHKHLCKAGALLQSGALPSQAEKTVLSRTATSTPSTKTAVFLYLRLYPE